jgi:hypothetical protein
MPKADHECITALRPASEVGLLAATEPNDLSDVALKRKVGS